MGATPHPAGSTRPGRLGILVAIVVVLAAGIWAIWREQSNEDSRLATGAPTSLMHDFTSVWSWSDSEFSGGAKQALWSVRFDGLWKAEEARSLCERLGIHLKSQSNAASNGKSSPQTYTGVKRESLITVTFWMQPGADQASMADAVILLQAVKGAEKSVLANAASQIEQAAYELDMKVRGSFSARGILSDRRSAANIVHTADAKPMEVYDDGRTRSVAYYTPKLQTHAESGGGRVNLQIAETRPEAGTEAGLVIGVPLISGDYSIQNDSA